MKVWIEVDSFGFPKYHHSYDLYKAFEFRLWYYNHKLNITFEKVIGGCDFNPSKEDIITGSIEFITKGLNKLGKEFPISLSKDLLVIPEKFTKRKIWKGSRNDFKKGLFVKPRIENKAFQGGVYNSQIIFDDQVKIDDLLYSEPIEIESEFRIWVHRNKIVSINKYIGEYNNDYPDLNFVYEFINFYSSHSPIAYVVDVGINKNDNFIIEVNDVLGTGTYGFNDIKLTNLMIDRFKQIWEL